MPSPYAWSAPGATYIRVWVLHGVSLCAGRCAEYWESKGKKIHRVHPAASQVHRRKSCDWGLQGVAGALSMASHTDCLVDGWVATCDSKCVFIFQALYTEDYEQQRGKGSFPAMITPAYQIAKRANELASDVRVPGNVSPWGGSRKLPEPDKSKFLSALHALWTQEVAASLHSFQSTWWNLALLCLNTRPRTNQAEQETLHKPFSLTLLASGP